MLLPGGALKDEVLNRAAKAARGGMKGGMNPLSLGGSGGLPRKFLQNL